MLLHCKFANKCRLSCYNSDRNLDLRVTCQQHCYLDCFLRGGDRIFLTWFEFGPELKQMHKSLLNDHIEHTHTNVYYTSIW